MRSSPFRRFTLTSILISLFAFASLIPLGAFGFAVIRATSGYLVQKTVEELK